MARIELSIDIWGGGLRHEQAEYIAGRVAEHLHSIGFTEATTVLQGVNPDFVPASYFDWMAKHDPTTIPVPSPGAPGPDTPTA